MQSPKPVPAVIIPALLFAVLGHCLAQDPGYGAGNKDFVALEYNNPDLVVDLGVGLWAWPLPMDYDEDGDLDLVVSCPDVPFNGTYFFENKSGGTTTMPVFAPPVRIGEGKKNLQVYHAAAGVRVLGRGVEYLDFQDSTYATPVELFSREQLEDSHAKIRFSQWNYTDFEGDGDLDLLVGIDDWADYGWDNAYDSSGNWTNGPLHGYVYLLRMENGKYGAGEKLTAGGKPIDVYGAPSPNLADFDGDGDLDLICGEFIDRFTWFENTGSRTEPVYAPGRFLTNSAGTLKMDLEMIIPSAIDWDKDGDIDLIVGDEDGRVALVENTGTTADNMPVFNSPVYFKQQAKDIKIGALATPFATDWDDDGDEDLLVGSSAGYLTFVENLGGGIAPKWAAPVRLTAEGKEIRYQAGDNGSIQGPAESKWGYTTLSVSDWDGDGLKDVIVNSIWGRVEWHKNIGTTGHPALSSARPVSVDWGDEELVKPEWNWWSPGKTDLVTQWRTTPYATDWNNDGLIDLIMLDTEGYLAYYERFADGGERMLRPGRRIFHEVNTNEIDGTHPQEDLSAGPLRLSSGIAGRSGRKKLTFADWDGDRDLDLIVNSKNAAWYENVGTEEGITMLKPKGDLSLQKLAGHTTSPTVVDWNRDGMPDLLLGAEDGFLYYFLNNE